MGERPQRVQAYQGKLEIAGSEGETEERGKEVQKEKVRCGVKLNNESVSVARHS